MMEDKERLFAELVERSKNSIYRICYSFVDQSADVKDLKQEIYIAIWNSIHRFEGESSWNTYIYRIAINTAIRFKAKLKKDNTDKDFEAGFIHQAEDPKAMESANGKLERMRTCIRALPEDDRTIIALVLENLTYKEISDVLGITVNHVGVKVSRAKEKLLNKMNERYGTV